MCLFSSALPRLFSSGLSPGITQQQGDHRREGIGRVPLGSIHPYDDDRAIPLQQGIIRTAALPMCSWGFWKAASFKTAGVDLFTWIPCSSEDDTY